MTEAEFLALDLDGSAPVDLAGALDAAIAYMDRQPVVEDAPEPPKPAWNRGVPLAAQRQERLVRLASSFLTTSEAAAYLRFRTQGGVRQLVMRGAIKPFGRGPNGTHMFRREELDRWMASRASP